MGPGINEITLLDWKRQISETYAEVRASPDPRTAWLRWRAMRDRLFGEHPQSPLPQSERASFSGLSYFDYDPQLRVMAELAPADRERIEIATSGTDPYSFVRFATASFELGGGARELALFWLEGYGGGSFLSFTDLTSGATTYGAGRYLLDTVKGADLGSEGERLVLDFNFSYNPSCSYDPAWVCPLAPPENRLEISIEGGEKYP